MSYVVDACKPEATWENSDGQARQVGRGWQEYPLIARQRTQQAWEYPQNRERKLKGIKTCA